MISTTLSCDLDAVAIEFLEALFEPQDIIEFRPVPTRGGKKFSTLEGVLEVLPWVRDRNERKEHIYFGANPRKKAGGSKAGDVLLARAVFADFDGGTTLEDAAKRIEEQHLPTPTLFVESGGGVHAWWRLMEPLLDLTAWTARQKAIAAAVKSDRTVHDAPRIMRLASTRNWKYPAAPVAALTITGAGRHDFAAVVPRKNGKVLPTLSMGDASRNFIYSGKLLDDLGRRATMFTVACDLKARGWDEREALKMLMERMSAVGLSPDELADCPRQIHNAFAAGREPLPGRGEKRSRAVEIISGGGGAPLDLKNTNTLDEVSAARRLAGQAAGTLRYCVEWKKWLVWDGRRWRIDDGGAAIEEVKKLRDSLWNELAELPKSEQEDAISFVKSMGAARRISGVAQLAASEPAMRVRVEQLDRHPFLLCVRNGVLDLKTMELRPHDPKLLITQLAEVSYGELAESQLWERFIAEATDHNLELAAFLQRAAGAALTGSVRDEILYCHFGRGANGKSTYLDALRCTLGDYATVAPPAFLAHRNHEAHPTELAMMHGKRLVAAIEMEAGSKMRESLVKSLTGGDGIQARRMREDYWTMEPSWKVHVSFNDAPRVSGTDEGIRRRLCVIPWRVTFNGEKRDSTLKERLCADGNERSGILNWALAGLRAWMDAGISPPLCVQASTEDFTRQQDSFGQFLDECCVIDTSARVEIGEFYGEFTAWLERRREHIGAWTSNRVSNELQRRNFIKEPRRTGGIHRGKYFYSGLGLLSQREE